MAMHVEESRKTKTGNDDDDDDDGWPRRNYFMIREARLNQSSQLIVIILKSCLD